MILMRHAQTVFNVVYGAHRRDPGVHDPDLTEAGRAQAQESAQALRSAGIAKLVTSPYRRALQTAEIVAGALDVPAIVEPLIRERAKFACDVGTPRSELARRWPDWEFRHLDERWWDEREEPEDALHDRCRQFCGVMADAPDWQNVLVITHWGVIRALTGRRVQNCETIRIDLTAPLAVPAEETG